jgi:hypothetical protein
MISAIKAYASDRSATGPVITDEDIVPKTGNVTAGGENCTREELYIVFSN